MRKNTYVIGLLMLLAVFAACKGESPTAPPTSTGGGGVPVTGATITLSASPAAPIVPNSTVITATVTQNNQPVPNGTAVEFTTDFGTFTETGDITALRTTTNGVATITLASSTAGKATIKAVVNNVSKTTSVTFNIQTTQCPPDCPVITPTITAVNPAFGSPAGGETVTITGTNFAAPVRVFFDFGAGTTPKEAFVVSRTDTQVVVTSPPVDLGTGQQKNATIIVVTGAGTADEKRASSSAPFVYQAEVLTPTVSTVSPDSGPIDGGTRITIFGSGFQSPVQVSFAPGASSGSQGWTAIQVVSVRFDQIVAVTPAARDVNPNGSGTLTGAVDLRVRNINSNTEAVKTVAFSYKQKMQITGITPVNGPSTGGTEIRIDGVGFNDPVTVDIGNATSPVRAQVIRVSGTQVIARTGTLASPCTNLPNVPVTVTNIDNGDSATSAPPQLFSYIGVPATITQITSSASPIIPGSALNVSVDNPGVGLLGTANIAFTVGDKPAATSPSTISNGLQQTFTVVVPNSITFPSVACTVGTVTGTQLTPASFVVAFSNVTTNCNAAASITISPPSTACVASPAASVNPPTGTCVDLGSTTAAGNSTTNGGFSISNTGGGTLQLSAPSKSGANAADFTIAPNAAANVTAGNTQNYTVTFDPGATGPRTATVTFTTNDPTKPTITVCLTGTGS